MFKPIMTVKLPSDVLKGKATPESHDWRYDALVVLLWHPALSASVTALRCPQQQYTSLAAMRL